MANSGSGPTALSWLEITTWAGAVGLTLEPGEAIALRTMSEAYASEIGRSDDTSVKGPFWG